MELEKNKDIFCKIIDKEVSADFVAESENWIAIEDIHPQAPVHVLVIPKEHFNSPKEVKDKSEILSELMLAVDEVANKTKIADKGFRVIINQGEYGGQLVPHFHIHVLGGTKLGPKIVK